MTNEEISNHLNKIKFQIDNPQKGLEELVATQRDFAIKRIKEVLESEFKASVEYLMQINRLPPEYSQK
jgi:hypothetical protein